MLQKCCGMMDVQSFYAKHYALENRTYRAWFGCIDEGLPHSWLTAMSPSSHLCEGALFTLTMVSALPTYLPHALPCAAPRWLADALLHLTPAPDSCKLSDFIHGSFQLSMKYKHPVPDRRWYHCSREPIYPKVWLQIRRNYLNLVLQESEDEDGESSAQIQLYQ